MSVRDFKGTMKISANASKLCIISVHIKCKYGTPADMKKYEGRNKQISK
jgi:hypothetical protein